MTEGHREGQEMFAQLGRKLGFAPVRSYSRAFPTDGVWYAAEPGDRFLPVPVVALEVLVSEARKTIRGSIVTLEMVSPGLGVLLVHDEQIRRGAIRAGATSDEADKRAWAVRDHAEELARVSRQRIEVWTFADLARKYRRATGARSIWSFGVLKPDQYTEAA